MDLRARLTARNAIRSLAIAAAAVALTACEHGDPVSIAAHQVPAGPGHGAILRQVAHLAPHFRHNLTVAEHARPARIDAPVRHADTAGAGSRALSGAGHAQPRGHHHDRHAR